MENTGSNGDKKYFFTEHTKKNWKKTDTEKEKNVLEVIL